jgi:TolB-like protein
MGDVLLTAFALSHLQRYLVAFLVCALPVVLLLSWLFDITPGGVERTDAIPPLPAAPAGSLAVLPFVNLSDDAENEYFSDGLTEEIRNQLARVPGLRVAARTSSFSFKGRHEDIREIGRLLNVAVVLEGGVRKQAEAVRINLQLVSAVDGFQIWSEQFERKLEDIFRLQDEVAAAYWSVSPPSGTARSRSPPRRKGSTRSTCIFAAGITSTKEPRQPFCAQSGILSKQSNATRITPWRIRGSLTLTCCSVPATTGTRWWKRP